MKILLTTINTTRIQHVFLACAILLLQIFTGLAASIPSGIKSTVVFIYAKDGTGKYVPYGTGFFVGVPGEGSASKLTFPYLVTAKHVLKTPDGQHFLKDVQVRFNKKEGETEEIIFPILLDDENKTVYLHPDTTVDIAVIPTGIAFERYTAKGISSDMLTTMEEFKKLKITEGSEVFFTGLFSPHVGQHGNIPITRFGRVALVSDEKINWVPGPTDLYLIECSSFGGNSGSPVFFSIDPNTGSNVVFPTPPPIIKLAGVVSGSFNDFSQLVAVPTANIIPLARQNMGISGVVPAYKLREILFGKDLAAKRKG